MTPNPIYGSCLLEVHLALRPRTMRPRDTRADFDAMYSSIALCRHASRFALMRIGTGKSGPVTRDLFARFRALATRGD